MKQERRITLNAKRMATRAEAHAHIAKRLRLPDWYGGNLDALNDCLGEIGTPTRLVLHNAERLENLPDGYGVRLLGVFERGAEHNPNLRFETRERRLR